MVRALTAVRTDPLTLEIMIQRFRSIAEEMGYALQRTGYTAFVNETADLGVALVTPTGEIFGYPRSIGITMFSNLHFGQVISGIGTLEEGDIVICNDPYTTGGLSSHLPDISLIAPTFADGELVCFAYAYVHSTDIGGKVAGSLSPSSYEIFQEGLRIPPTKLYRAGKLNQDFVNVFLANCRIPKDNWGDVRAMVTALRVGKRRVQELVARFGRDVFANAMEDALDYSERRARHVIGSIPDGIYHFSDYLDDDGATGIPIKFCVAVHIRGDNIHLDFAGSDPQVRSAFNLFSNGAAHPWLVYKIAFVVLTLQPDIPVNAGLMRPVSIDAPEGSVMNCAPPAAVGLRTTTGVRIQDAICGALARALPDVIPAAGAGYIAPIVMAEPSRENSGVTVNVLEPMVGGTGASSVGDGLNARDVVDISNLRNSPLEIVESKASVLIRNYALRPNSAGPGRFRGGLGTIFEFEVLAPNCLITARGQERHRFHPWGLAGGGYGEGGSVFLRRSGSDEFVDIGKIDSLELSVGDVVRMLTPGGGGFGPPFERDPHRVLADVLDGFVGLEEAERVYGTAIKDGKVDLAATRDLRASHDCAALESDHLFALGPERTFYEDLWTEEVWAAFSEIIYGLPPGSRNEARTKLWHAVEALRSERRPISTAEVRACWEAVRQPARPRSLSALKPGERSTVATEKMTAAV